MHYFWFMNKGCKAYLQSLLECGLYNLTPRLGVPVIAGVKNVDYCPVQRCEYSIGTASTVIPDMYVCSLSTTAVGIIANHYQISNSFAHHQSSSRRRLKKSYLIHKR